MGGLITFLIVALFPLPATAINGLAVSGGCVIDFPRETSGSVVAAGILREDTEPLEARRRILFYQTYERQTHVSRLMRRTQEWYRYANSGRGPVFCVPPGYAPPLRI